MMKEVKLPSLKAATLVVLGFITLVVASCSIKIVEPGYERVQVTFGNLHPKPLTEGPHIVNPLSDFYEFYTKQQKYCFKDLEIPAEDKLKSKSEICTIVSFIPGAAPTIYQDHGTQEEFLMKHLPKKTAEVVRKSGKGIKNSEDFFKEDVQATMVSEIKSGLIAYLEPLGLRVHDVQLVDIDLPPQIRTAIQNTKDRAEKVRLQEQQLEIVNLEAQEAVKKADAERDAAASKASAIRDLADANAYKIEQEALAQAKANRALRASINQDLVEYVKANRWNGEYPKTLAGADTNMLLMQNQ